MEKSPALLDTDQTRNVLQSLLHSSNSLICFSAFFTSPAFDWVNSVSSDLDVSLVVRGRVDDFLSGSSSISAVESAVAAGWKVHFHSALHAKVYVFEETLVVGSGNLTSNGLNLLSGRGNIEFSVSTRRTPEISSLIDQVLSSATKVGEDEVKRMRKFLESQKTQSEAAVEWPPNILETQRSAVFCSDFPMSGIRGDPSLLEEPWRSIVMLMAEGNASSAKAKLESSVAYCWIRRTIEASGCDMRFGALTQALHDDLADDLLPYRVEIKQLLANLLSFLVEPICSELEVVRPRHTQVVRFR